MKLRKKREKLSVKSDMPKDSYVSFHASHLTLHIPLWLNKYMASHLKVTVGQFSDRGRKPTNQDYCGVKIPDENLCKTKGIAIAIADGISSSEQSKEASTACVTGFLADYFSTPETWSVKKSVQQVLTALNSWLYNQGKHELNRHRGHVTTLSALVLKSTTCHVIHVGDSRIYQLREDYLNRLALVAESHSFYIALEENDTESIKQQLAILKNTSGFDYLHILDTEGNLLIENFSVKYDRVSELVFSAAHGKPSVGIEIFDHKRMLAENKDLAQQMVLPLIETARARPTDRVIEDRGMVIRAV